MRERKSERGKEENFSLSIFECVRMRVTKFHCFLLHTSLHIPSILLPLPWSFSSRFFVFPSIFEPLCAPFSYCSTHTFPTFSTFILFSLCQSIQLQFVCAISSSWNSLCSFSLMGSCRVKLTLTEHQIFLVSKQNGHWQGNDAKYMCFEV